MKHEGDVFTISVSALRAAHESGDEDRIREVSMNTWALTVRTGCGTEKKISPMLALSMLTRGLDVAEEVCVLNHDRSRKGQAVDVCRRCRTHTPDGPAARLQFSDLNAAYFHRAKGRWIAVSCQRNASSQALHTSARIQP